MSKVQIVFDYGTVLIDTYKEDDDDQGDSQTFSRKQSPYLVHSEVIDVVFVLKTQSKHIRGNVELLYC